jgi:hypothetical protein
MNNNILNDNFFNTFLFQNYIWSCSPCEFSRWLEFISLLHGEITYETYKCYNNSNTNLSLIEEKRLPIFKKLISKQ